MKGVALMSVVVLVAACFFPWVTIPSKGLILTGLDTTGTSFGKPAILHFFLTGLYLFFLLLNKSWSQKLGVLLAAFNLAWAMRNFMILSTCQMGECPEKQVSIYLLIISAITMLLGSLYWRTK